MKNSQIFVKISYGTVKPVPYEKRNIEFIHNIPIKNFKNKKLISRIDFALKNYLYGTGLTVPQETKLSKKQALNEIDFALKDFLYGTGLTVPSKTRLSTNKALNEINSALKNYLYGTGLTVPSKKILKKLINNKK